MDMDRFSSSKWVRLDALDARLVVFRIQGPGLSRFHCLVICLMASAIALISIVCVSLDRLMSDIFGWWRTFLEWPHIDHLDDIFISSLLHDHGIVHFCTEHRRLRLIIWLPLVMNLRWRCRDPRLASRCDSNVENVSYPRLRFPSHGC